MLTDAPVVYRDDDDGGLEAARTTAPTFKGEVTLRDALVHSMNIPAMKVAVVARRRGPW